MRVSVIGVGFLASRSHPDFSFVQALAPRQLPPDVPLVLCEKPMPDVLDAVQDVEAALLVNVARSGRSPGRVEHVPLDGKAASDGASADAAEDDPAEAELCQAIATLRAREELPSHVERIRIELASMEPGPGAVVLANALQRASRLVVERVAALRAAPLPSEFA